MQDSRFQNVLGVGGCLLYFISHPLQNSLRIDKESQFLAMSNIRFILLPGASPPGPPTGLCPCTPLGASAAPRPLACLGTFGPHSRLLSKYHCLLQILLTALLDCKIPGPLIYISSNKNKTIVIYVALQSTLTHVNKSARYSAIAPTLYTRNMYVVMSNQHCFKTVSQIIRVHAV